MGSYSNISVLWCYTCMSEILSFSMSSSLRSDVFILEVREGVGGGGGSEEMSSCSHVLLTPVQQLILRSSQSLEHHIKCWTKMRLRIPTDKQHVK